MKDWRLYERFVAQLMSEQSSNDTTVIPNARIKGAISRVARQVDVLIDSRHGEDVSRRVIVDAKRYRKKIDVKDVESFKSMMEDCRAHRGIMVCPNGYTPAALRRAQDAIAIRLVPLNELDKLSLHSWDSCLGECFSKRRKGNEHGLVLWDSPYGLAVAHSPLYVMTIGKCDSCSNFHIWCWACGEKFALKDEDERKCSCPWFWLTSIEEEADEADSDTVRSVHLSLILLPEALSVVKGLAPLSGLVLSADRRPLQ
jgi:hypothetical protein